tara:strand:- start:176 stop:427 length:252 start_codon:yes stop_codon:yes gene_type:complete
MPNVSKIRIKTNLRMIREARNVSTDELAEHCGVDDSTIRRWERGWPPPDEQKVRIARFFGQPVEMIWIFDSIPTTPLSDEVAS